GVRPDVETVVGVDGGLTVSYQVQAGTPAGVALLVRPGTLASLDTLVVSVSASRVGNLVVTLQDSAGVTYALPSISVRPGTAREHQLELLDASYLAPASSAPDPGVFDPAQAVMISILDLAGYMGGAEAATQFTLSGLRAHL